jgi:Leucine-rich repeat (LRR) protein
MRLSSFDRLTHLSISDNGTVGEVDLAHLPSLQVLHCERMQLTSLIVNGSSLQALFASNNRP